MRILPFAVQGFLQSLSSRDTKLVLWTQGILATLLLILTMTSGSVQGYLAANLKNLMGADILISQTAPMTASQKSYVAALSEKASHIFTTSISLSNGSKWQRVALKVVDDQYPVQGELQVSAQKGGRPVSYARGPKAGDIWIDSRVATKLSLQKGDFVTIGEQKLRVDGIVQHEPDRMMEGHTVAMRAIVTEQSLGADFAATGKRTFRTLMNAGQPAREKLTLWAGEALPDATVIDRHSDQHPLAAYWHRVENFMGLTFILLFFMAAIAINLAGQSKVEKDRYRLSIFMSMGLTKRASMALAFVEWCMGFLVTVLPALLVAYGVQSLIQNQLQDSFIQLSGPIDTLAVAKTVLLLFALFLSIQMPMFIQLSSLSMLALIREQAKNRDGLLRGLWTGITVSILVLVYTDNWLLTSMIVGLLAVVLLLLVCLSWLSLISFERLSRRKSGLLPFVIFMMRQRLFAKTTQILSLGLSVTLLLVSLGLMQDLKGAMNSQVRNDNGNLVISDAPKAVMANLQQWADNTGSKLLSKRPFVHASVVEINGVKLADYDGPPSEALSRLQTPVRLSWSDSVPDNNRVTGGAWWQAGTENYHQVSLEDEIMSDMGLAFGDQLTFDIGGQREKFALTAAHVFKGGGSSITFWFQAPLAIEQAIAVQPHYMGNAEASQTGWEGLGQLLSENPLLHVVSLEEITRRLDQTFALVTGVTGGFSVIIILLTGLVLMASVSGYEEADRKRNGLLLSMGLTQRDCYKITLYDWLSTAFIASIGAIVGTWAMGDLTYRVQLSMTYEPDFSLYALMIVLVSVCVSLLGLYFCRRALSMSVKDMISSA